MGRCYTNVCILRIAIVIILQQNCRCSPFYTATQLGEKGSIAYGGNCSSKVRGLLFSDGYFTVEILKTGLSV